MKKIGVVLAVILISQFAYNSARADNVGAVFGLTTGLLVAGPPGAIIGFFVGEIFGKPWWGPDQHTTKCWIDSNFHRNCPKFPVN